MDMFSKLAYTRDKKTACCIRTTKIYYLIKKLMHLSRPSHQKMAFVKADTSRNLDMTLSQWPRDMIKQACYIVVLIIKK